MPRWRSCPPVGNALWLQKISPLIAATTPYACWNGCTRRCVAMMSSSRRVPAGATHGLSYSPGSTGSGCDPRSVNQEARKAEPKMEFDELARRLDEAYRTTAARFPQPGVRLEKVKNKAGVAQDTLILTGLDKVEEPESLRLLRHRVARRQPLVDLPELLLEIQARTGFASEFSHISEARSRLDDLPTSICAVLLAEACNVWLTPMVRKGIPALERDRLLYVQQNYIRPDTLSRANARLVDYQATILLAKSWGGVEVASAYGLLIIVPLRPMNAGPNP